MENENPNSVNNGGLEPESERDPRADIEFVQDIPLKDEAPEPPEEEAGNGGSDGAFELYGWVQAVVSTIVVVVLIFTFLVRVISVDGSSMYPTLYNGDRLLTVSSIVAPKYEYGDIVVLRKLSFEEKAIVKRVIATEGQTVNIDFYNGLVYVDGALLAEEYINEPTMLSYDLSFPLTVPEGCLFVMGDNRNASADSRTSRIGMVDTRYVIGRALFMGIPGPGEKPYNEGGRQFSRIGSLVWKGDNNG